MPQADVTANAETFDIDQVLAELDCGPEKESPVPDTQPPKPTHNPPTADAQESFLQSLLDIDLPDVTNNNHSDDVTPSTSTADVTCGPSVTSLTESGSMFADGVNAYMGFDVGDGMVAPDLLSL